MFESNKRTRSSNEDAKSLKQQRAEESLLPYDDVALQQQIINAINGIEDIGRDLLQKTDPTERAPGFLSTKYNLGLENFKTAVLGIKSNGDLEVGQKNLRAAASFFIHCYNNIDRPSLNEYAMLRMMNNFAISPLAHLRLPRNFASLLADVVDRWENPHIADDFFDFAKKNAVRTYDSVPIAKEIIVLCPPGGSASRELLGRERMWTTSTWVTSGDLLMKRSHETELEDQPSAAPSHLRDHLCSEKVNFISGPSGSGKTACAVACAIGLENTITLFNGQATFRKQQDKASTASSEQNLLEDAAVDKLEKTTVENFVNMIGYCICGDAWKEYTRYDENDFVTRTDCYQKGSTRLLWNNATIIRFARGRIHIVLDEMGVHRNMILGLCRLWYSTLRPHLARCLGCNKDQLFLIVAGAGLENFEDGPGSDCGKYHVLVPTQQNLFSTLLRSRLASSTISAAEKAVGQAILQLLYRKTKIAPPPKSSLSNVRQHPSAHPNATIFKAVPSDPVTHRFLQLVEFNSRCAALAMRCLLDQKQFVSTDESDVPFITPADLRSMLSAWTKQIAYEFSTMNDLGGAASQLDKEKLLAEALFITMVKAGKVAPGRWATLGQKYGLVSDDAFWVPGATYQQYRRFYQLIKRENTLCFVYIKAKGRFSTTPAHVALYMTRLGCVSGTGDIPSINWRLFESCTAEYVKLCWTLNLPSPSPPTYKYTPTVSGKPQTAFDVSLPAAAFCPPHALSTVHREALPVALYKGNLVSDFDWETTDAAVMQAKIEEMRNGTKKVREQQVAWFNAQTSRWREMIVDKNAGIILENCGATSLHADLLGMVAGKLFLIQCKYDFNAKMDGKTTEKAFTVSENDGETIQFLINCCCRIDPLTGAKIPVDVESVLVVAQHESVDCSIDVAMAKNELPQSIQNLQNFGKFNRRLVVAFPSIEDLAPAEQQPSQQNPSQDSNRNSKLDESFTTGLESSESNPICTFFPVLQFPFMTADEVAPSTVATDLTSYLDSQVCVDTICDETTRLTAALRDANQHQAANK